MSPPPIQCPPTVSSPRHKVLTETVSDNETRIKEMKKGVEDAKQKIKSKRDTI